MQGCFVKVNRENKVEFYLLNNSSGSYEQINASSMNSKLEINNKYGPVNVVSFTMKNIEGENVTLRETTSIAANGETVIEVQDNPFMVSQNAREQAISALFGSLVGFEYIPTVFNYKARLYNDCGDKIQVYDVDSEDYVNSLILNQTIVVPATRKSKMENKALSKTQVKNQYISKTEQEGSHTEIMVDKQNQQITSVVSQVTGQDKKIAEINQKVDEISAQISDIADITTYGESSYAEVELGDINTSEPVMLKVHPTVNSISYLYPFNLLYPSNSTFMSARTIRFENTEKYIVTTDLKYKNYKKYYSYDSQTEEYTLLVAGTDYTVGDTISGTVYEHKFVDYILPDDLLYYDSDTYDEFYLDYESQTCQVTKRCQYNADGTVSQLQSEVTTTYDYPLIALDEGDYKISILGYQYGYIYVRLMAKNIYTDQFYTKSETNSLVSQTADSITLGVNQTLTNYSTTNQMNSAINLKAGEITSTVASTYETKTNAQTNYSQLRQTDSEISTTVGKKVGKDEVISKINQSPETVTINANKIGLTANNVLNILSGNTINLTSKEIAISSNNFSVDKYGNMTCNNANISGNINSSYANITGGYFNLSGASYSTPRFVTSGTGLAGYSGTNTIYPDGIRVKVGDETAIMLTVGRSTLYGFSGGLTVFDESGAMTVISPRSVTPGSLEKYKKNFEKLEDALEIVKNIDIYKYNLKSETNDTKKHIGFVIGDNYKYRKEVTSIDNDGADLYSFISVCCKAIQEQQNQIEELKKEINKLKEGK